MKHIILLFAAVASLTGYNGANAQSKNKSTMTDYHQTTPTNFIEVGGNRYAYRVLGNQPGIPLILFQHFTGTMDNWDPAVTNGLAQHYKVIIFDNKGIGASEGQTPDNIADMAKDATGFIKALGYKKINILGFSMGGFIAQEIALSNPELINKLILAGTGPKGGEGIADIGNALTATQDMSPDEQKLYFFYSKTAYSRDLGKASLARIHQRVVNRDPDATMPAIMSQLKSIVAWGQPDTHGAGRLKQFRQPVLIVNGNNDIIVPTINSYVMFQNFPNAHLSLYPDANHGAIFQYHDLFLKEALAFLGE